MPRPSRRKVLPVTADLALAGFATTLGVLDVSHDSLAVVLAVFANAPVLLRRRYPIAVVVIVVVALSLFFGLGYKSAVVQIGVLVAAYTVAVLRPLTEALTLTIVSAVVVTTAVNIGVPGNPWINTVFGISKAVAAVCTGHLMRIRARHLEHLAERAQRMAREKQLETEQALMRERVRIARELHDVVAHHLSVIAVHTSLAQYVLDTDRATTSTALDAISASTSESLEELRRLVGVLRTPDGVRGDLLASPDEQDPGFSPQPGIADLPRLVERASAAGVATEMTISGKPRELSPGPALCVYRVAQEALTNVIKHAGGAEASVHLTYGRDHLTLRVQDTGVAKSAPSPTGHGITGMRERASMYSGTLEARVPAGGGWEIILQLPYPPGDSPVPAALSRSDTP